MRSCYYLARNLERLPPVPPASSIGCGSGRACLFQSMSNQAQRLGMRMGVVMQKSYLHLASSVLLIGSRGSHIQPKRGQVGGVENKRPLFPKLTCFKRIKMKPLIPATLKPHKHKTSLSGDHSTRAWRVGGGGGIISWVRNLEKQRPVPQASRRATLGSRSGNVCPIPAREGSEIPQQLVSGIRKTGVSCKQGAEEL